jgi:hypothetical protein
MTIIAGVLIAHKEYFNNDNRNINNLNNIKHNDTINNNKYHSHKDLHTNYNKNNSRLYQ